MSSPSTLIANLITSIRQRLWLDSPSEQIWTDARITEQLQSCWVELWETCVDSWGTGYFEQDAYQSITPVAGGGPYALTVTPWQILGVYLLTQGGNSPLNRSSQHRMLEIFTRDDESDFPWPQVGLGKPHAWRPAGQGIRFYPEPDQAYWYLIRYVPLPPAFTDSTGGIDNWLAGIPQMYEYLVVATCRRIAEIDNTNADVWTARQGEILARLRKLKPGEVVRAPKMARIRKRYLGPALQPWWRGR